MVLVTRASQLRSFIASSRSAVAKNLIPFAGGLPRGFNKRAATRHGMSCGWQFNTHAVCSAVRRAGNWPSSVKNLCWSSLILRFAISSRHYSSSSNPACPARRSAAGMGMQELPYWVTTGSIAAALAQSLVKCRTLPLSVFLRVLRLLRLALSLTASLPYLPPTFQNAEDRLGKHDVAVSPKLSGLIIIPTGAS